MTALPWPGLAGGVRPARPGDVGEIVAMITELADYERSLDQVKITPDRLDEVLFADRPGVFCLVAESDDHDPTLVGMALFFLSFSTWEGVQGIYLEDLYVRPAARGTGLGKALLRSLAMIATARGCARLEWSVLDWNTPSIDFYEAMGARPQSDWTTYRLTGEPLETLAAPPAP